MWQLSSQYSEVFNVNADNSNGDYDAMLLWMDSLGIKKGLSEDENGSICLQYKLYKEDSPLYTLGNELKNELNFNCEELIQLNILLSKQLLIEKRKPSIRRCNSTISAIRTLISKTQLSIKLLNKS